MPINAFHASKDVIYCDQSASISI